MDLANNAERVNHELQDLSKGQSVMVSMADHVLDTKKRVEYGVHQILLEVGDLVKTQGNNINSTLNQRFDGISSDIMDNQNGALANLTSKMEQEMNKVNLIRQPTTPQRDSSALVAGLEADQRHVPANDGERPSFGQAASAERSIRQWYHVHYGWNGEQGN